MTIRTFEAEERRQRQVIIGLFSIAFLSLGYVLYDYTAITGSHPLPEDPALLGPVIEKLKLKSDGLVRSLDIADAHLVVNEQTWKKRRKVEKANIVAQLARYCADQKKSTKWTLQVVDEGSGAVLAELGTTGLRVD
ncbi:MAG: hypothetical protein WBD36_07890 [Bacteroidota bacterium]